MSKTTRSPAFYGVRTTGIYCRTGCPSRRPNPGNIVFFDSATQAEAAGFRPCKRCRPDRPAAHPHLERIRKACRMIEQSQKEPVLEQLADAVAMSPFHFQRTFRTVVGLTPKQYARAHRMGSLHEALGSSHNVTEAIMDAGWESLSRGYADAGRLGMKPSKYQKGGLGEQLRYGIAKSPLGWLLVAATARGVCLIALDDTKSVLVDELQRRFPHASLSEGDEEFRGWMKAVVRLAENPASAAQLPLDIQGTAFQERVWRALKEIPAGSTVSYAQLAKAIGKPKAVRAVASACGANPAAIAIPCHRVVGSDGALHGYRWGIKRKQALLELEKKQ